MEGRVRLYAGTEPALCQVETPQGAEYFFGTTDGEIWHGDQDGERWTLISRSAPVSKCIHQEMLTGRPVTELMHFDGARCGGAVTALTYQDSRADCGKA